MKILFLLENTNNNDEFRYTRALVDALAQDGYEPSICFTTSGTKWDYAYQLVKPLCVHHKTNIAFASREDGYTERLARHIDKTGYGAIIVSQAAFPNCNVAEVFGLLETRPRLIFVGHQPTEQTTKAVQSLKHLEPAWVAVSQNIATRFMPEVEAQIIYGPAVKPASTGCNIREQFNIRPEARVIGFIGNSDDIPVDLMLETARRFKAGLLIAGTGTGIARLSEHGNVRAFASLPECREDWYKAFDVFLYPVLRAGFPTLPLEAALCGCPVAMTPVADMFQLCEGKFQFSNLSVDNMVKAVAGAVNTDVESVSRFVGETFSVEKMLSGWQVLFEKPQ